MCMHAVPMSVSIGYIFFDLCFYSCHPIYVRDTEKETFLGKKSYVIAMTEAYFAAGEDRLLVKAVQHTCVDACMHTGAKATHQWMLQRRQTD